MIELAAETPDNVVIATAHGRVRAEDYEGTLLPAVSAAWATGKPVRLLYVLAEDFEGYELHAALEDARLGLHHWYELERIGLVTDHESYRLLMGALGFLMPGQARVFHLDDVEVARSWITADLEAHDSATSDAADG